MRKYINVCLEENSKTWIQKQNLNIGWKWQSMESYMSEIDPNTLEFRLDGTKITGENNT